MITLHTPLFNGISETDLPGKRFGRLFFVTVGILSYFFFFDEPLKVKTGFREERFHILF